MHTEPSKQREQIHLENVMDGIKDGVEADAQNATVDKIEDQAQYSAKELHGILRRIDLRVVPALGLMFGISLMDRSNISAAIIAGMEKDLHLQVGYRYSLIILCFFITYVIVQIPMTIVCRKLGPRYFLPGVCGLWGGLIVGFGFSNNWTTLLALRLVLGCLEAGYFPGSVYLLSTWYTRCKCVDVEPEQWTRTHSIARRDCFALLLVLPDRCHLFFFGRHPRIRAHADEWSSGNRGLAMVCIASSSTANTQH